MKNIINQSNKIFIGFLLIIAIVALPTISRAEGEMPEDNDDAAQEIMAEIILSDFVETSTETSGDIVKLEEILPVIEIPVVTMEQIEQATIPVSNSSPSMGGATGLFIPDTIETVTEKVASEIVVKNFMSIRNFSAQAFHIAMATALPFAIDGVN